MKTDTIAYYEKDSGPHTQMISWLAEEMKYAVGCEGIALLSEEELIKIASSYSD